MDSFEGRKAFVGQFRNTEVRHAVFDARTNRFDDRIRFFMDLLYHEVRIAALFGRFDIPIRRFDLFLNRFSVTRKHRNIAWRNDSKLALVDSAIAVGIL